MNTDPTEGHKGNEELMNILKKAPNLCVFASLRLRVKDFVRSPAKSPAAVHVDWADSRGYRRQREGPCPHRRDWRNFVQRSRRYNRTHPPQRPGEAPALRRMSCGARLPCFAKQGRSAAACRRAAAMRQNESRIVRCRTPDY